MKLDIDEFVSLISTRLDLADYPHAAGVERGVLLYEAESLRSAIADGGKAAVLLELAKGLSGGPGVVVVQHGVEPAVLDAVSVAFQAMIDQQHRDGAVVGDHFAKPGANDRVWNAFEKLAVLDPCAFVDYYNNDMIALGLLAWLGPGYQITSQVNVVNPGGMAQAPHRDYPLGFMSNEQAEAYPDDVHTFSPMLTLQAAVAHSDMSVESGPTLLLPHSQRYVAGYLAWRDPAFIAVAEERFVQLPLAKGDIVFFNPALFHAGGSNRTSDVRRMANLLQVSSALSRTMETIDRDRICVAIYPDLLRRVQAGATVDSLTAVIAAGAEGYAFPTNLDRDPPVAGLAPASQQEHLRDSLHSAMPPDAFEALIEELARRKRTHDV